MTGTPQRVPVSDKTRNMLEEIKEEEEFSTFDGVVRYLIQFYRQRRSILDSGASIIEDLVGGEDRV